MTGRIVAAAAALLVAAGTGFAKPATQPATNPAAAPATRPAAKAAAANNFPTPGELMAQLKAEDAAKEKLLKVAYIDLDQPVVEQAPAFSLFGSDRIITVHSLIDRLHQARDDKKLRAVLINFGSTQCSFSQAQEIRSALDELRRAGKRTFVYADAYDTDTYAAACAATDVCLLKGGEMEMPGVGLQTMFYKGLFDKVGVKADYIQIGEYKGADEEYTRTGPSDELRGELNKLVDSLFEQIIDGIAVHRNLSKEQVKQAVDEAILSARAAKERNLVDHLTDRGSLGALLKDELGGDVDLQKNYGIKAGERPDFSNIFSLLQSLQKKPEQSDKPAVALVHAEGVITDGEAGESLFGGGGQIGGEDLRKALRDATYDDNIKAIVLRIDSPGGSALASEVMWQGARRAAEKKPLIISIGGMAASGGYYLASAGDHIFADPSAIVGSIGVVGGKFVLKDLFDKVGVTTESFTRGRNADLFSSNQPFTDRQRKMVTNWMRETYEQFTERVMTQRKGKIKDIDQVARGRIFVAQQAKDLGMVDELGGIEAAISYAANKGGLQEGKYDVRTVPQPRSLTDLLTGGGSSDQDAAMAFRPKIELPIEALLGAVPPATRKMLAQQLCVLNLLQKRPVILVSPYVISVR